MATEFESRAEDLFVAIGPAIGACCYEVGEDVRSRFIEAGSGADEIARWFLRGAKPSPRNPSMPSLTPARPDHWFFDGWRCAREQLLTAGVPGSQIFTADCCTASHAGAFCSYRRDGAGTGRQAAVIRPRPSLRLPGDPRAR
jgi:copper oxidase (laccase) domain-containing protein